jgi:hypothetical protein
VYARVYTWHGWRWPSCIETGGNTWYTWFRIGLYITTFNFSLQSKSILVFNCEM